MIKVLLKIFLKTALTLSALFMLLISSLIYLFYNKTGQQILIKQASYIASNLTNKNIQIENISGDLLTSFTIEKMILGDSQGPWVIFEGLHIDWQSKPLLMKSLLVENIIIDKISYLRHPISKNKSQFNERFYLPIQINHFLISDLDISSSVIDNKTHHMQMAGYADLKRGHLGLDIQTRATQKMQLTLKIDSLEEGFILSEMAFIVEDGRIFGKGCYNNELLKLNLTIQNFSTDLIQTAGLPIHSGKIDGKIDVSGSLENPQSTFSLSLEGMTFLKKGVETFPALLNINGSLENRKASISGILSNQSEVLATFSIQSPWLQFPLSKNAIPLAGSAQLDLDLNALLSILDYPEHHLTGRLTSKLQLKGTYQAPKVDGLVSMRNAEYVHLPTAITLNHVNLDAKLFSDGNVEITKFSADAEDGHLEAKGTYRQDFQSASIDIINFPTKILHLSRLPIKEGVISGHGRFEGTLKNPNAQLNISMDGFYSIDDFEEPRPVKINIKSNVEKTQFYAGAEFLSQKSSIGTIDFRSSWNEVLNLGKESALSGKANLDLELASLMGLVDLPEQRIMGQLRGDFALSGSIEHPLVRGTLQLKNGEYEYKKAGTLLDGIILNAIATGSKIEILELSGRDFRQGQVYLKGGIDWESGLPVIKLTGKLNHAHLIQSKKLVGDINGTISLNGPVNQMQMTGMVDVTPFEIKLSDQTSIEIPQLDVISTEEYARQKNEESFREPFLFFDILANAPNRIFVRGSGLEAELSGKLNIIGNNREPIVEGALSVIRGQYEFLNKKFKITQGKVWLERNKITLDILAETKASDVTAAVNITGSPDDIRFSITSIPSLPQDEIISRVLFGSGIRKLSPFQAVQLANAVQNLSGTRGRGLNLDLLGKTRSLLKIDNINIDTNNKSQMKVGVGKYLRDDTYIQLEQGATTQDTQATMEVELTPNISIESTAGTGATIGDIKIIWRRDY